MENVRKHGDFELGDNAASFEQLVNGPTYKHRRAINENLLVAEKEMHTVEFNKRSYMGMSILVYSSFDMYSFYFLGLWPLAGYASLKLYHVMSCFLHEKRSVRYDMAG